MRPLVYFIPITVFILSLISCGGGGGGDGATAGGKVIGNASITGYYEGTIAINGGGSLAAQALISGSQVVVYTKDGSYVFQGNLSVNGNSLTGGLSLFVNGTAAGLATLNGTVKQGVSITSTFSSSSTSGNLSLSFSSDSNQTASVSAIVGTWSETDGADTITVTIQANGDVNGSDTDGCVYNGSSAVPQSNMNIYTLTINLSSCGGFDGTYTGLASLLNKSKYNEKLMFALYNSNAILIGGLSRP